MCFEGSRGTQYLNVIRSPMISTRLSTYRFDNVGLVIDPIGFVTNGVARFPHPFGNLGALHTTGQIALQLFDV